MPDSVELRELIDGALVMPDAGDLAALAATPDWARPLLDAALDAAE